VSKKTKQAVDIYEAAFEKHAPCYFRSVRQILQHQKKEDVDRFIEALSFGSFKTIFFSQRQDFKDRTEKHLDQMREAIKTIKKLREFIGAGHVILQITGLENAQHMLEYQVGTTSPLKTGGRRSQLRSDELEALILLRNKFSIVFPRLSHEYSQNNLLFQLGVALLAKSLPRSLNKMLEKYQSGTASALSKIKL
jgi:hypothetical protein